MAIQERVTQEDLYLYEILRNPVLCGEFIYNYDLLEGVDEPFTLSWYQKQILCDFNSKVSITTARATGKTVSLTTIILWALVYGLYPGDYILYTVPSKVHLEPVFTNLIRYLRSNSFLKQFIEKNSGINSSDFKISLNNGSTLFCRIAGQSGTGANVIGLHTPMILVDEAGYYSFSTFLELQPSLNVWTTGHRELVAGVPTGVRERNVLYHADMENKDYTKHRVTAMDNPRITEEDRLDALKQYGGEESDDYIHYFLGKHGKPTFSLFDRSLFNIEAYPVYQLSIDGLKIGDLGDYQQRLSYIPMLKSKEYQCIIGVDLGYCYSADTEVLTKRGWVGHDNIQQDDIVACYDTNKDKIVWDGFEYLWEQDYKGKMVEVDGKLTNFLVSPEHTIWSDVGNGYERLKAKDLLSLNKSARFKVRISATSDDLVGQDYFDVPYYYCSRKDRQEMNTRIPMSDWVEFLGWFISEGSAGAGKSWEVNLTQAESRYANEIDELLKRLPYKVHRKEFMTKWGRKQIAWQITCKELSLWLRENCGIHSKNKKVPDFIFKQSSKNRELFLRTLLKGDGQRVNSNRSPVYTSQSKVLLNQVQHLAVSLGYYSSTSFYEKDNMGRTSVIPKADTEMSKKNVVREVDYDGRIYCLKTPTGYYVTRRKGKVAIQGNTEPSAIAIMYLNRNGQIRFHSRIRLTKVSYPIQEKIIDQLDTKFDPLVIGVDRGNAGISVIQNLMEGKQYALKNYKDRLVPIDFSGWTVLGIDSDGNEIKSRTKPFTVSILQDYSNSHKLIYSSTDLEMVAELERMTYTKNAITGDIAYKTLTIRGGKTGEDHFTSALLCGCSAYYLKEEFIINTSARKRLFNASWA